MATRRAAMRVAIATVQVPFILGGAESHARGLMEALVRKGHAAEIVALPFSFSPPERVRRAMELWQTEDFTAYSGYHVDRVICLKFPAYYCQHPSKVLWLIHQHRAFYELWHDQDLHSQSEQDLRAVTLPLDTAILGSIPLRFAASATVSTRLRRNNGVSSIPLYHPPPLAGRLSGQPAEAYIFCPSRLESLKRQPLLIEAMALVRSPVCAVIAGEGSQWAAYQALIDRLGIGHRVRLMGRVDDATMAAGYAMSLGVFFGPYEEDYGYVTLEAMLSGKPIITCRDSGGPLEFVRDGQTGLVIEPTAEALADAIERLAGDPRSASEMGQAGRAAYAAMGITWDNVVNRLLA